MLFSGGLRASVQDVLDCALTALKKARKIAPDIEVAWTDVLTLPLQERVGQAEVMRFTGSWSPSGTDNLRQTVYFKGKPSPLAPCLTRRSAILWDCKSGRLQLAEEALTMMGIPVLESIAQQSGYKCPIASLLMGPERPPDTLLRVVAGNGIHLGSFGALFLSLMLGVVSKTGE